MNTATNLTLPTHKDLPETDGVPMENAIQMLQIVLLTKVLAPVLAALHPDGRYFIGQDVGIYYRRTDPPLDGCKAPDWFYVPGVDPLLEGEYRRSYVLWIERQVPPVLVEFASGTGAVEHDATPPRGKFWVYERLIAAPYYVIFNADTEELEVFELVDSQYRPTTATGAGRFPVPPLGVELGVWHGTYQSYTLPWLRAYRSDGTLLPTPEETAEQERQRADRERRAKEAALAENERLLAKLRELGHDPGSV
jgi:Uma2 family endonuclease